MRGNGDEEFVFDSAVGVMGFVPPQAAASGVPAGQEVGEDVFSRCQVLSIVGVVVDADPGEGPPGLVVIVVVYEALGVDNSGMSAA